MSSTNICSDLYDDPALILVDSAWGIFKGYADEGISRALEQIDRLNNFTVSFHNWDSSFDATGTLSGFVRPTMPTLPTINAIDLSGDVPNAPSIAIESIGIDAAPNEPDALNNPPSLDFSYVKPVLNATDPGDLPVLVFDDKPIAPTITLPDLPTLDTISVPDAPTFSVEMFSETAPEFDAPVPNENVSFIETAYSSTLLDEIKATLSGMIQGNFALPAAIADALWGRALSREDGSTAKLKQTAREEFSSRGIDEPNGMLSDRLFEVEQTNRSNRNSLNRDLMIQEENIAVENLRIAVNAGIQLESTLLQAHLAIQQRKFELAIKIKDVAIAVFNAQVARYNALITAYNARVDAYKAFLDGLRAQVDLYRGEVEAAKVRGEINVQRAQLYAEQIRGEISRSDIYRAQVEGFRASIEAQRAVMDGYRASVDAFKARVEAYGIEWNGVQSEINAEVARGNLYNTVVEGYSGRVNVWAKKQDVRIETHKENLTNSDALLRQHDNQVKVLLARLEALKTYTTSQGLQSEQLSRIYEAAARVESSAVEADNRAFSAETERARARSEAANRDASLQITQTVQIAGLLERALESAAQASSQVAASSFSAVNFSAGVSSSQGRSKSCSTSFSYSGEIIDAGA